MSRSTQSVAMCVSLVLFVTGCANSSPVLTRTETEYVLPPAQYTAPCRVEDDIMEADTVAAMVEELTPALIAALRQCNADKRKLREWRQRYGD